MPELLSVVRESDITTQDLIVPTLLGVIERVVPRGSLYVESVFKVVQFTHKPTELSEVCRILQSNSRPQQIKVVTKCISVLSGTLLNDALLRLVFCDSFKTNTEYVPLCLSTTATRLSVVFWGSRQLC